MFKFPMLNDNEHWNNENKKVDQDTLLREKFWQFHQQCCKLCKYRDYIYICIVIFYMSSNASTVLTIFSQCKSLFVAVKSVQN